MKVLERRIKQKVNKQVNFIKENIEYITIEQVAIIQNTINNINKIEKSIEILFVQGIIDRQCYALLIDYLYEMKDKLYNYKYQVSGTTLNICKKL